MKAVRVAVPVLAIGGAFIVWAAATNRLQLWAAYAGAYIRSALNWYPKDG